MGLTYSKIKLSNPRKPELLPVEVNTLVDLGALFMSITETLSIQLQLDELEKRSVKIADGSVKRVPFVGPIRIDFENRFCFTGAMALGDEPLLGAVLMEELDVILHPATRRLVVNPEHPNA
ncbi:MAG: hypothetical protein ABJA79_10060, partial [Parafilimonas sp.]